MTEEATEEVTEEVTEEATEEATEEVTCKQIVFKMNPASFTPHHLQSLSEGESLFVPR